MTISRLTSIIILLLIPFLIITFLVSYLCLIIPQHNNNNNNNNNNPNHYLPSNIKHPSDFSDRLLSPYNATIEFNQVYGLKAFYYIFLDGDRSQTQVVGYFPQNQKNEVRAPHSFLRIMADSCSVALGLTPLDFHNVTENFWPLDARKIWNGNAFVTTANQLFPIKGNVVISFRAYSRKYGGNKGKWTVDGCAKPLVPTN
ncbi:hypothetical protein G9A89_017353 [Geosiphon pyriformis]|nr:hypothetical protein G9A89_017353 [Geosiphon pyriformis]